MAPQRNRKTLAIALRSDVLCFGWKPYLGLDVLYVHRTLLYHASIRSEPELQPVC